MIYLETLFSSVKFQGVLSCATRVPTPLFLPTLVRIIMAQESQPPDIKELAKNNHDR